MSNHLQTSSLDETGVSLDCVSHTVVSLCRRSYLAEASEKIDAHIALSESEGWHFAAKLVRGAYISGEAARGNSGALQPTKAATDAEYEACAALLLRSLAEADRAAGGGGGGGGGGT